MRNLALCRHIPVSGLHSTTVALTAFLLTTITNKHVSCDVQVGKTSAASTPVSWPLMTVTLNSKVRAHSIEEQDVCCTRLLV
jgi:hypothetical protein